MMVLDQAAKLREYPSDTLAYMLSALVHDFGKAVCTKVIDGELHSYDHEMKGLPLVDSFISRLTNEVKLKKYVLNMTELHMKPNAFAAAGSSIKSTNKLFDSSIDPTALLCLSKADGLGKTSPREYVSYDDFFEERLAIYREYMSRPFVTGQDLIDAGIQPSKDFSEYLDYAHKLRLAGVEKGSALKQTLAFAKKTTKGDIK